MKFILLTQNNCPNCEKLKIILKVPLKGVFDSQIKILHKETNETEFFKIADKYQIKMTPCLVNSENNKILSSLSLLEVKNFLSS